MADRPFREKRADIERHPEDWEEVSVHTERATRRGARQRGVSIQRVYKHKRTGETIVRHTVIDDRGQIADDHYRRDFRPRVGDV
jgi:hypothetical protein